MTLKKRACASVRTHIGDGELQPGDGGLSDDPPPPRPSSHPACQPLHLGRVSADTCLS